jgi:adenine specific DNA methylase Mod
VLFKEKSGEDAQAQIEAFDDTWTWNHETELLYTELMNGSASNRVKDTLEAMRKLLGDNDVLAYLIMMTVRLVELHRVLKPRGSLYLHCDPTASHYLKVILDAVFGAQNFKNEVIWKRHNARSVKQAIWPRLHDVLLVYSRSTSPVFNVTMVPFRANIGPSRHRDMDRWQSMSSVNKINGQRRDVDANPVTT